MLVDRLERRGAAHRRGQHRGGRRGRPLAAATPTASASSKLCASDARLARRGGPAVVIGAGGAARAVVAALIDDGAPEIRLVNRTAARAEELAEALGGPIRGSIGRARAAARGAALLVNAHQPRHGRPAAARSALDALPQMRSGERHRLCAAGNAAAGGGAGARQSRGRRAGHAAAPGAARLRRLVRGRCRRSTPALRAPCWRGWRRHDHARPHRLGRHGQEHRGAAMLRRLGSPVHDADAAVHRLLAPGGAAVAAVEARLSRRAAGRWRHRPPALGARVFGDPAALKRLEAILHPLVRAAERRFLARARRGAGALVVLDIPLLFETGGDRRCDQVWWWSPPRPSCSARG